MTDKEITDDDTVVKTTKKVVTDVPNNVQVIQTSTNSTVDTDKVDSEASAQKPVSEVTQKPKRTKKTTETVSEEVTVTPNPISPQLVKITKRINHPIG